MYGLPATHVLLMPFVTNEFLFCTGLAGTIVSTLYNRQLTALLLFRIVKLQFSSNHISGTLVALIACAVFLTNPSVLYMGIVPMMEAPFMMFFMLSVYYLQRLFHSHIRNNYEDSNISSEKRNTSIRSAISMSGQTTLLLKCSLVYLQQLP